MNVLNAMNGVFFICFVLSVNIFLVEKCFDAFDIFISVD